MGEEHSRENKQLVQRPWGRHLLGVCMCGAAREPVWLKHSENRRDISQGFLAFCIRQLFFWIG